MAERLLFTDPDTVTDAMTFARRSALLLEDAVRLQAADGVLVMTAAPLAPRGFGDPTPTVLAMRTLAVDADLVCDIVVAASALLSDPHNARAIVLPETGLSPAWAGVAPPRAGWEPAAPIDISALDDVARAGMAQVADAVPTDAGEDVVRAIRAGVWARPAPQLADLPRGVAFAAAALGFLGDTESARVYTSAAWTRLSLRRGHVLVRRPPASGLTAVRVTGRRG